LKSFAVGITFPSTHIYPIHSQALADNECLETVSFRKSNIGDKGCEVVCNTAKYLNRIEVFDLSECGLTSKGAEHVADMLKVIS